MPEEQTLGDIITISDINIIVVAVDIIITVIMRIIKVVGTVARGIRGTT